jgi:hypothetical protein
VRPLCHGCGLCANCDGFWHCRGCGWGQDCVEAAGGEWCTINRNCKECCSCEPVVITFTVFMNGDVNNDGETDIADVLEILKYLASPTLGRRE